MSGNNYSYNKLGTIILVANYPEKKLAILLYSLAYTVLPAYSGHVFLFLSNALMMMFSHVGWEPQVIWS